MSVKTTYTCDRCGHSQETNEQLWTLTASLNSFLLTYSTTKKSALWCRNCVEQFGLLPIIEKEKNKVIEPGPTLEDLLRAIIRSEIKDAK